VTNNFVITNSGIATLNVTGLQVSGANSGDFTVGGVTLPAAVAPGANASFQVLFSPTAGGARSATLQITNNDSFHNRNPFTISLSGAALGPLSGKMGSGGFQLEFSAAPGQSYTLLATDDLTKSKDYWTALATGSVTSNPVVYMDPGSATNGFRFYTIRSP
jgi:hypothetical protein